MQVADDTWFALEAVAGVDTATLLREAEGVVPEVAVSAEASDLVGAGDAVLQRALELLR